MMRSVWNGYAQDMTTTIHLKVHGDSTVRGLVEREIRSGQLRDHYYLESMEEGAISPDDVRRYVGQYRYFVAKIPWMLADLVDRLPGGPARDYVAKNLEAELLDPTRLEIYDECARSIGVGDTELSRGMMNLLATYDAIFESSDSAAAAALLSHEYQSPGLASSVAQGVRHCFGDRTPATGYWDMAVGRDTLHSRWLFDGIDTMASTEDELRRGVRMATAAWSNFFDEQLAASIFLAS
jgi:pyrroloquinoline quinone (PQQ) biosynthesis protein C